MQRHILVSKPQQHSINGHRPHNVKGSKTTDGTTELLLEHGRNSGTPRGFCHSLGGRLKRFRLGKSGAQISPLAAINMKLREILKTSCNDSTSTKR
ncbi:hypothetical protein O181_036494 [Austropuccinia psidii MF-1]|uniref:Uncharacterized protein n=1 Tax=Austropuccinia psidii MF-1 TaxID=1389203 RepID=A0A9Q3HBL6_9BASI|nr:hypothetical protein [Austropuccinia psidii MF-1]